MAVAGMAVAGAAVAGAAPPEPGRVACLPLLVVSQRGNSGRRARCSGGGGETETTPAGAECVELG